MYQSAVKYVENLKIQSEPDFNYLGLCLQFVYMNVVSVCYIIVGGLFYTKYKFFILLLYFFL